MNPKSTPHRHLLKFLLASVTCFFIGTVHGVLQVIPSIRQWLDSIGSPYGGPGHMIDPLAHAHINVVGGVVIFIMGATYYLIPKFAGIEVYSKKLVNHTFWWTTVGIAGFYSTLMFYGIAEGIALLESGDPNAVEAIHGKYGPTIAIVASVMGMGFWIFFYNILVTFIKARKM